MDPAIARTPSSTPVAFEDGLGQRRLSVSVANEPLELLALREDLTAVSSFEFALRDRVSRLSSFQSEHYSRVRGVERVGTVGLPYDGVSSRLDAVTAEIQMKSPGSAKPEGMSWIGTRW